ncbi:hypothetical protein ABIB25_002082 [Nakamurella sp. UYEF19]|uniref:Lsr2 family DNA-binding protein n=1 Tax=Nakamurella sp. UYEF19 TaxID=1756392 RepID=UPI00339222D3
MARRRVEIISSDLTGKEIGRPEEVAELRVLKHPLIDAPVRLDAYVLEVAGLENSQRDLVTIELALPNTPPERIVLDREVFDKLFKVDVAQVLSDADLYEQPEVGAAPKRRSRSADGSGKAFSATPGIGREQREAIRTWANANGFTVGDRGRIAANITQAFEAAHQS